jgi:hypothetical protein
MGMRLDKILLPVCLLASLAACQVSRDRPVPSDACSRERVEELPVSFDGGFILVPGAIDANPVSLIVHTAAQRSIVASEIIGRLHLDRDAQRRTQIHGLGGEISTTIVRVMSFAVGQMEMLDRSMAVAPILQVPETNPPVGGILGNDFLSSFDLDLDFSHQRITLYQMQGCHSGLVPWPQSGPAIPLRRLSNTFLLIELQIDEERLVAEIDSGARASLIASAAARRVGVTDDILARDPSVTAFGIAGTVFPGHSHRFRKLRIGPVELGDPVIEVTGTLRPGVDMLLGADFLRTLHVWLSNATGQLFFAPPGL